MPLLAEIDWNHVIGTICGAAVFITYFIMMGRSS